MFFSNRESKKDKTEAARIILPAVSPKSAYAEAFRTLRTSLYFSVIDRSVKSLVVTSALQSEGKTNTTANMGYAMASAGKKVLLVDSDLRRPFLTDIFGLKGQPGFTDLLVDTLDIPVTQGDLREVSLGDLILLIRFQKLTGSLELKSDRHCLRFDFREGKILDVIWQDRPPESDFLALLVRDNVIRPDARAMVTDIHQKTGQRRRSVLLSLGIISRPDLEKRLALQAAEAMRLAAGIRTGTFSFLSRPWEAMDLSVVPETDFPALGKELFNRTEDLTYINHAMDRLIHATDTENLFVLGAGRTPPNPSEIIGSERTEVLVHHLTRRFDWVIIDIAPVLPASDAMLMAPRTDGVLLVVRSGYANKKLVKQVTDQFRNSGLPLLGVILNRVKRKGRDAYYQYYQEH